MRDYRPEYTPSAWSEDQRKLHEPATLDDAMHHASCLAGGWYRRPVRIDGRMTKELNEVYSLRPFDVAIPDGWSAYYTITAHNDDGSPRCD